jgi:hypothetical protein
MATFVAETLEFDTQGSFLMLCEDFVMTDPHPMGGIGVDDVADEVARQLRDNPRINIVGAVGPKEEFLWVE